MSRVRLVRCGRSTGRADGSWISRSGARLPVRRPRCSIRPGDNTARNSARSPSHTARVRSRAINVAQTHIHEWSSIPVNALALVPSASRNPPTISICHNSIGAPRSQRSHLRERRSRDHQPGPHQCPVHRRFRGHRAHLALVSSNTNRRGPQYGRDRRNSAQPPPHRRAPRSTPSFRECQGSTDTGVKHQPTHR